MLTTLFLVSELDSIRDRLSEKNEAMKEELNECKITLATSNVTIDGIRQSHFYETEELGRKHRYEITDLESAHGREIEKLRREAQELEEQLQRNGRDEIDRILRKHKEDLADLERSMNAEVMEERARRSRDVQELTTQRDMQLRNAAIDIGQRDRETDNLRTELKQALADLEREKVMAGGLREKLSEAAANGTTLEASKAAMKEKIDFLESNNQQQSQAFEDLHKRMQAAIEQESIAKEKLRVEETLRRKLHNQVQELKGNIRVFCRVRPTLGGEVDEMAKIEFPDVGIDNKEITVQGPEQVSSLGKVTTTNNAFTFDRSFGPSTQNAEVFEEISQLVQSAL